MLSPCFRLHVFHVTIFIARLFGNMESTESESRSMENMEYGKPESDVYC